MATVLRASHPKLHDLEGRLGQAVPRRRGTHRAGGEYRGNDGRNGVPPGPQAPGKHDVHEVDEMSGERSPEEDLEDEVPDGQDEEQEEPSDGSEDVSEAFRAGWK